MGIVIQDLLKKDLKNIEVWRINMSEKRNVMCCMCKFEVESKCTKKKSIGVHINKKRICDNYKEDDVKVAEIITKRLTSPRPEVIFRPDWYYDRKKIRRQLREEQRKLEESPSVFTNDPAHPLTGDLSRFFKSTVGEES